MPSRWNRTIFVTCFCWKRDRELFKSPIIVCHSSSEGKRPRTLISQSGIYPRSIKPVAEDVRQRAQHWRNQRSLIDTFNNGDCRKSHTLDFGKGLKRCDIKIVESSQRNHLKTGSYNSWPFKANDRFNNTFIFPPKRTTLGTIRRFVLRVKRSAPHHHRPLRIFPRIRYEMLSFLLGHVVPSLVTKSERMSDNFLLGHV
jgi:hypothetical protein